MNKKEIPTRLESEIGKAGYTEFTSSMTPEEAGIRRSVASKIPGITFRLRDENDSGLTDYGRAIAADEKHCVGTTRVENLKNFDRYTKLVYYSKST